MAEVETTRDGAVLTIALNRPDTLNALDGAVFAALNAAIKQARAADVRAVVVTGTGRGFCVGQDVTAFRDDAEGLRDRLDSWYHPAMEGLRALEKPVIAAVNGACAGAGLSLACAADVRIASDRAVFVPAFINLGLVPDAGASWFLPRLIGPGRTFHWLATSRKLGAEEALAWGLVEEVVPADELPARAAELAARYAAMPTKAVAALRRLVDHAIDATFTEQLELEAQIQGGMIRTADFREGVTAFFEKRPPSFTGA